MELQELYRISIPDGSSYYWRLIDIGGDGLLWWRVGSGSGLDRDVMLVSYDDMVIEARNAAHVGKKVTYTPFTRSSLADAPPAGG